jgi:hypothetical protein
VLALLNFHPVSSEETSEGGQDMDSAIALLLHYNFELGGYTIDDLRRLWSRYDTVWVQWAIIECLFQGRYKAISVLHLLDFWERKGRANCHYTKDFERLMCGDLAEVEVSPMKASPEASRPALPELTAPDSPFLTRLQKMCDRYQWANTCG